MSLNIGPHIDQLGRSQSFSMFSNVNHSSSLVNYFYIFGVSTLVNYHFAFSIALKILLRIARCVVVDANIRGDKASG